LEDEAVNARRRFVAIPSAGAIALGIGAANAGPFDPA
jgi:hypothetical protein